MPNADTQCAFLLWHSRASPGCLTRSNFSRVLYTENFFSQLAMLNFSQGPLGFNDDFHIVQRQDVLGLVTLSAGSCTIFRDAAPGLTSSGLEIKNRRPSKTGRRSGS